MLAVIASASKGLDTTSLHQDFIARCHEDFKSHVYGILKHPGQNFISVYWQIFCMDMATTHFCLWTPAWKEYCMEVHCFLLRWVRNYLHCRYMFCSWLHCWLSMTKHTWSTPLLPLWCRCDLDSPFLSWVFCHKHGHSQFYLYQRRAEGSDPFLWAEGVPGVKMHRMMSVQYGNSVMSQRIVC